MRPKGSILLHHGSYYFVSAEGRKRVWHNLRTKDKTSADKRAAELFGLVRDPDEDGEAEFLRSLIRKGEEAKRRLDELMQVRKSAAVTIANALEVWRERDPNRASEVSMESYRAWYSALAGWCTEKQIGLQDITPDSARNYVAHRLKTRASAGREATFFRRMFRVIGLSNAEAWAGLARMKGEKKRFRRLSIDEIRRLIAALREGAEPGLAEAVILGYNTGLRRGDVEALDWAGVDEGLRFVRMVPRKTARHGKEVVVPLTEEAQECLRRLAESYGRSGRVFGHLGDCAFTGGLRRGFAAAGIGETAEGLGSFHSLRVGFISMLDEAGISPHLTDAITGHASFGMHGRYSRPGLDSLIEAVRRGIPPIGSGDGTRACATASPSVATSPAPLG